MSRRAKLGSAPLTARGLTVVEVLVALAIAAIVLGITASLLSSARAATAAQASDTEPARVLDLAAEILAEEIGLAGFEPWQLTSGPAEPAIVVSHTLTGQVLTVSFVDDRLAGPALDRVLTFEASEDSSGRPQLYRRSGTSSRQPVVAGITRLAVQALVSATGVLVPNPPPGSYPGVRGLVLGLREEAGTERLVVIRTPSSPQVEVR
ncbi:MAG TPA: prepilin-type N-terminal cleavage/methylation domain-containing protein [Trueperaceae bacterium]